MASNIELLTQRVCGSEHTTAELPPSLAKGPWDGCRDLEHAGVEGKKPDGEQCKCFLLFVHHSSFEMKYSGRKLVSKTTLIIICILYLWS